MRVRYLFLMLLSPGGLWGVSLESRLLYPHDLPASCQETSGSFPLNAKVDLFYQYKVYRSVVPPVANRHAQSFDCAGQKGTLYFFEYSSTSRLQDALLFAQPVLSESSPPPTLKSWDSGFVIISFSAPPTDLMSALDRKLGPPSMAPEPTPASTPVSTPSAAVRPMVPPVESTTLSNQVEPKPASLPIGETDATPGPAPAPALAQATPSVASPAPHPLIEGVFPDVSDIVLKSILDRADCKGDDLSDLLKAFCSQVNDFRHGTTLDVLINDPKSPRVGSYYVLDFDGSLEGPRYEALIGSGKIRQVTMVPLFSNNGVDDLEVQALIDSRQHNTPWPRNEMSTAIAAYSLPNASTSASTNGRSQVLVQHDAHYVFIRRAGRDWVYLGVDGLTPTEQLHSDVTVGRFY